MRRPWAAECNAFGVGEMPKLFLNESLARTVIDETNHGHNLPSRRLEMGGNRIGFLLCGFPHGRSPERATLDRARRGHAAWAHAGLVQTSAAGWIAQSHRTRDFDR